MEEQKLITLAILVDNEAGVLSQISRMFSRKGYNIESISAGPTTDPDVTRITIEVYADSDQTDFLCNQVRKLIPVRSLKLLDRSNAIRRELVLIKVATDSIEDRNEVIQIANIFRASTIDVCPEAITLAMIGDDNKIDAICRMLEHLSILELARTGMTALERGRSTIDEHTKEKGEFDYGKNVL